MQGRINKPEQGRCHFAQENLRPGDKKEIPAKPYFVSANPVFGGNRGKWLRIWDIIPKYGAIIW